MELNQTLSNVTFPTKKKDAVGLDADYVAQYFHVFEDQTTESIFANKKVLIFGMPNLWRDIDTQQVEHIIANKDALMATGLDAIHIVSPFETYTLAAYEAQTLRHFQYISDANLDFTESLGMKTKITDQSYVGKGETCWRYAILVENKVITRMWQEDGYDSTFTALTSYPPMSKTKPTDILRDLNTATGGT